MKYPRTPHLPWSPGLTKEERKITSLKNFLNKDITITEKLDGSNIALTSEGVFARSHSGHPTHESFNVIKAKWAEHQAYLDPNIIVYAEYCWAIHTIQYEFLPTHTFIIAAYDKERKIWYECAALADAAEQLGIRTAPILFCDRVTTTHELEFVTNLLGTNPSAYGGLREGVVVRTETFFEDFETNVAKWVRKNHVSTDVHWSQQPVRRQNVNADGEE